MYRHTPASTITKRIRWIYGLFFLLCWVTGTAYAASIDAIRISNSDDRTRVVLDLSSQTTYKLFTLNNPSRLVIDLAADRVKQPISSDTFLQTPIKNIRYGKRPNNIMRVVFDLHHQVFTNSFLIPASKDAPFRLVIDLPNSNTAGPIKSKHPLTVPAISEKSQGIASTRKPVLSTQESITNLRKVIVAIDPGHGGKDPGAVGKSGTREKEVVMDISRKLAAAINAEPGMSAVLIRNGDYFITLRGRIKKARELNADVFLSIHADAAYDRRANGSSVYVLSPHGASSEAARILAEKENQADLIGGVDLEGKDATLKRVLVDLSQTATIDDSNRLAKDILRELGKVSKTRKVERAGFAVLKSPDIPSVLIETAFISNPHEEKRLRSATHQQEMARAIVRGLKAYLIDHAPKDTLLASRPNTSKHTIKSGETLSGIAQRYQVSIKELRHVNALQNDRIRAGQTLVIPTRLGS